MNATILGALIGGAASLLVCLINNAAQQRRLRTQLSLEQDKTRALLEYKLEELTKHVEKHNSVIERTYKLEGRMNEAEHDIRDIKNKVN